MDPTSEPQHHVTIKITVINATLDETRDLPHSRTGRLQDHFIRMTQAYSRTVQNKVGHLLK